MENSHNRFFSPRSPLRKVFGAFLACVLLAQLVLPALAAVPVEELLPSPSTPEQTLPASPAGQDAADPSDDDTLGEVPEAAASVPGPVVTPVSGYARVKLSWDAVEGATGYTVYRAASEGALAESEALGSASDTTYTFTDATAATGTAYWYRVDAALADGVAAGTPVQADATGFEALQANAALSYDLLDTRFDGSVTLDKTEDLSKIIGLTQGSVIVKVRYTGPNADRISPILGIGNSPSDVSRVAMFGVQQMGSDIVARYELCDKLYSTGATFAPFSDGQWHTIVYTAGKGYVNVTVDGKSGANGTDGYYADSKWDNFLTRTQNANSLTIGGIQGITSNTTLSPSKPYANWVGDIAYVTVTDEVLLKDAANKLTAEEQLNTPEIPDPPVDPNAPVVEITAPVTVSGGNGPTVPEALDSLKTATDLTVFVDFQQADTTLGSLFSVSNSKADAQHFHLYTWGGKIGYEMRGANGTTENLSVSIAATANAPHKAAFVASSTDHTFKLFVDGVLVDTKVLNAETYHMLFTIPNLDSVSVGKILRDNGNPTNPAKPYLFNGTINGLAVYTKAVTDKEALDYTAPARPDGPVIEITAPTAITNGNGASYPDTLATLKGAADLTVTAQFVQSVTAIGSLFSISNSSLPNHHFHVYANGPTLGFELRGDKAFNIGTTTSKLRSNGVNTIAFSANSTTKLLKLFVNGELAATKDLSAETYRMLKDIEGLTTVDVGKTVRSTNTNGYPFTGTIAELAVYTRALSDAELIAYTGKTPTAPEQPLPERTTQPFVAGITGDTYFFRIPALYTLQDGTVMAAIDARFGGAGDSPNNLDTTVNFLRPGQKLWEGATLPNHFVDYSDGRGGKGNSASFIDPVIVQSKTGRIFMVVDAFPYGAGYPAAATGSGTVEVNGQRYLALTNGDYTNLSSFRYYIDDERVVRNIGDQSATDYTVDGDYNLVKNGVPLTVKQGDTNEQVPMNIFYSASTLRVYKTSYLWVRHSDDMGKTWSDAEIVNPQVKADNERFLGVGPGRGHTITTGKYAGRVLIPLYDDRTGERASVMYTDDNGATWTRGADTTMAAANSPGKSSESQIIELPDGTLRMFARGSTGKIGYCDSTDGGESWSPMVQDPGLPYGHTGTGCMISVINYSEEIDGKPALILSSPEGPGRMNGIIRIGLINDDNTIDWTYKYSVNQGRYIYSCLTELPDGTIGLLYEDDVDSDQPGINPRYFTYTIDELMSADLPATLTLSGEPAFGQPYTVTLPLSGAVVDGLSNVNASALTVTYPDSEIPNGTLTFKEKAADGKGLVYQGTWPAALADGAGYRFSITLPANFPVFTLDGQVAAAKYAPLTGLVGSYQKFPVTVSDLKNGVITADSKTAEAGKTVTLTVTPASGYGLKAGTLSVSGVATLTPGENGTYTFVMPSAAVTVTAAFEKVLPANSGLATPGYARNVLVWNATDGTTYTVYRGESAESQTTQLATGLTKTTYTDTVATDTHFWYRVDTVNGETVTAGVPFRASLPTGVEALKESAIVYVPFTGAEQVFDGTRVVDMTHWLDDIKNLTAGTVLMQMRFTGTAANAVYPSVFTVGGGSDNEKAVGYFAPNGSLVRYGMGNGMHANATGNLSLSDGKWHTAALVSNAAGTFPAVDGVVDLQYASKANLGGFFARIGKVAAPNAFTIGGKAATGAYLSNLRNWTGDIAYVLITDEALTPAQAQAVTLHEQSNFPDVSFRGKPPVAGVTGSDVGTVVADWNFADAEGAYLRLAAPAQGNNNDKFALADGKLTTLEGLVADQQYTVVVECGIEGGTSTSINLTVRCRALEQPFYAGDGTGAVHYRIPGLITLQNGNVMAAIDARYGDGDSPDNLDTAVRVKDSATGQWGEITMPNHFLDYPDEDVNQKQSASFIDPAIIQAEDGRIYLLVDAWPYGAGLSGGNCARGTGTVTVDGKQYLALTDGDYANMSSFKFYIGDDMRVYNISDKSPTAYSVDAEYNLYEDGALLYCEQFVTGKQVPMNIFYQRSALRLYKTSYLWLRTSDDNGKSWSAPQIITNVKSEREPFLGVGPGRGYQIKTGEYAGRILFDVYDNEGTETSSVIYSDDQGATWQRGGRVPMGTAGLGKSSESQLVELPDGTLRIFCRTGTAYGVMGYIGYADSTDGGKTWTNLVKDEALKACANNQISALNYSQTIDGKSVVLLSFANKTGSPVRQDGSLMVGVITENPDKTGTDHWTITWGEKHVYQPGRHDYSCLTELPNGDIAVYHENLMDSMVAGENMVYREFSAESLGLPGKPAPTEYTVTVAPLTGGKVTAGADKAVAGDTVTLTVQPDSGYSYTTGSLKVMNGTESVATVAGANGTFTFVMPDGDVIVTAGFTANPVGGGTVTTHLITVSVSEGGKITPTNTRVNDGGSRTFQIKADKGYVLTDLLLDGISVPFEEKSNGWTYTLTNVRAAHTLEAVFALESEIIDPETPLAGLPFLDVTNHWAASAIAFVAKAGLMTGTGATTFNAEGTATRATVATILHRMAGSPTAGQGKAFTDVTPGSWYANAVAWCSGSGIMDGVSANAFAPDRNITRQELALLFCRYAKFTGMDVTADGMALSEFSDQNDVADWAKEAMRWAVQSGVITGEAGQKLDPSGAATRAELAVMLQRLEALIKK